MDYLQKSQTVVPVFAENAANQLIAALIAASSLEERDKLLQDFADRQGFFDVLNEPWSYYHYGKLAEIAEANQKNQLAEILRFAWKIDDVMIERKPQQPHVTATASQLRRDEPIQKQGKVSDGDETRALALRSQAMALLQQAAALDGLKPFIVVHNHVSGTSSYVAWSRCEPTNSQAASVLDFEFEPERKEWLAIESNITLDELVGLLVSSRVVQLS